MESPRRVVDPAVLKALSHPVRRRAIEALVVSGPATVSRLSDLLGEPVGKLSFHLTQLAKHGLIEEAPELAKDRRERWWRSSGFSWSDADFLDDPVEKSAADAAYAVAVSAHFDRVREYRRSMADWGKDWADAAYSADHWFELTPSELRELTGELEAVLTRWQERARPDDGEVRERVYTFTYAFPRQF
jgi:DNA-binding transcriptional ArsR family regulator